MMKNGFGVIEIIVAIFLVSLVAGGIYILNSSRGTDDRVIPTPTQPVTTTTPSATVAPTDDYSNWETYTNSTYRFSFKYPKDEIFISDGIEQSGGKDYQISIKSKNIESQINNGVDLSTSSIGFIDIFTVLDRTLFARNYWNTPTDFFDQLKSLQLNQPEVLESDLRIRYAEYTKTAETTLKGKTFLTFSVKPTKQSAVGAYPNYFAYTMNGDNLIVLSNQQNTDLEHNLPLFKQIAATFTFVE
ncbi:hypothetical protein HGA91_00490 [candidate division WWE3 bacterium]|nr:hypothetical protein [candidate division WWE3 bacterium]